jgi:hypothetical protein
MGKEVGKAIVMFSDGPHGLVTGIFKTRVEMIDAINRHNLQFRFALLVDKDSIINSLEEFDDNNNN